MSPDYREMARGMTHLAEAMLRTEARLLNRWLDLVSASGGQLASGLSRDGSRGDVVEAARTYVRGAASLPELAMMDLVAELDAVRARSREDGGGGGPGGGRA